MTLLEVAKHALEAMEDAMYRADTHEFYDAKESLRYAIEQAEQVKQEPVAWMESPHGAIRANRNYPFKAPESATPWVIPLYTAPSERRPLTDEEIINIGKEAHAIEGPNILPVSFARAIERAHGIGEQA